MRKFLSLAPAQRFSDFTLLLLRLFVGLFLIWGVWDNISESARMQEYAAFLGQHGFPSPRLMAPLSAWLQLAIGIGFVLGMFTRWAGILCAVHFVIAIAMVDHHGGMRGVFPSGCLVLIGLYLATYGAGRFSIDAALRANELPRAAGGVRLRR
ncbi:MAG TPA: DoxX family protein [Steroidobacteraceae bacterium]|nr:DoxX family protein [Steroidobacteraceae bacterium]